MILISTAIAVAAGCGTEMQREMISLIDEQEQAAREISEIVEENLDGQAWAEQGGGEARTTEEAG